MKRTLLISLIPLLAAPMIVQAGPPHWGTRDRTDYNFGPYQRVGTGVFLDSGVYVENRAHVHDWDDDRNFKGCPPGLAKKNNGCMPPGQAKKHKHWH